MKTKTSHFLKKNQLIDKTKAKAAFYVHSNVVSKKLKQDSRCLQGAHLWSVALDKDNLPTKQDNDAMYQRISFAMLDEKTFSSRKKGHFNSFHFNTQ